MEKKKSADKKKTRDELKKMFGLGQSVTAESFASLIESTTNIVDDQVEGKLELVSEGENESAIKFKKNRIDSYAIWEIANTQDNCLLIKNGADNTPVLILRPDKTIELGSDSNVVVNGKIYARSICGNVGDTRELLADGFWHDVLRGSDGAKSYEITASCETNESNYYFFLQKAYATQFSNNPISLKIDNRSWKTLFSKHIQFKWVKEDNGCVLKVRTNKHYANAVIKISVLEIY
ncbi:hypothetical protein LJB80_01075 [Bacteroides sp. OttesenSCG-928-F21]|nr:hypothetical protein [Bacteroides sp. OttesenSCG-928-F21]